MSYAEKLEWTDWTLTRLKVRGCDVDVLVCEGRGDVSTHVLAVAPLALVVTAALTVGGLDRYLGSLLEDAARVALA